MRCILRKKGSGIKPGTVQPVPGAAICDVHRHQQDGNDVGDGGYDDAGGQQA